MRAPVRALWALVLALLLAAGSGHAASPPPALTLRVGLPDATVPDLPNSVLWLAKDAGFYAREGLDVDLLKFQGSALLVAALRIGDVDVGNIATQDVVRLTATKQLPLVAINSADDQFHFLIAGRSSIRSVADLRGKIFGIFRQGSLDDLTSRMVLETLGVSPRTVRWAEVGSPATRARTLLAGRIDATAISIGTWEIIRRKAGVSVLVDPKAFFAAAPIVQKVDAVTARVLREKPEELHRFVLAILKASRYFGRNKAAWIDAIVEVRPDLKPEEVGRVWDQLKGSWAVNGQMNLHQYRKTMDVLYRSSSFKGVPRITTEDWMTTRFVDAALKEIGVDPSADNPRRPIP